MFTTLIFLKLCVLLVTPEEPPRPGTSGSSLPPAPKPNPAGNFFAQFSTLLTSTLQPISENLQTLTTKVKILEQNGKPQAQMIEHVRQQQHKSPVTLVSSVPEDTFDEDDDDEFNNLFTENDEVDQEQEQEHDHVEEDGNPDLVFDSSGKYWVPEDRHVQLWNKARNMDSEHNHKDDWVKPIAVKTRKFLTSHPAAKPFQGPAPDDDIPVLRYKNQKLLEKQLVTLQGAVGAGAAAITNVLSAIEYATVNLQSTSEDYRSDEVAIVDPREEAAQIFTALRSELQDNIFKKAATALKLMADSHNKITHLRRHQFVDSVSAGVSARNMVKRLQPSKDFLFGGEISKVCKTLKDGNQLANPLQRSNSKGNFKKSFKSSWQPQQQQQQQYPRAGNNNRVDRFKKFKKKF